MRNFNEIFMKDVTYDHIKSRKKARLYPLFRRYIFGKNPAAGGGQIDPSPSPPSRFSVKPRSSRPKMF